MQFPVHRSSVPLVSYTTPRRRRWHDRRVLIGTILAVIIGGGLAAKPAWHYGNIWRARRLATATAAFVRTGGIQKAAPLILEADRLAPHDPVVLNTKLHFMTVAHVRSAALAVWERILNDHYPLTPESRRDYAELALEQGELGKVGEQLRALREAIPAGTPEDALLGAKLAERYGDRANTAKSALEVLAYPQGTESQRYEAALLILVNATETSARTQAWNALNRLAEGNTMPALQALAFLSSQQVAPTIDPAGREGLAANIPALIQRLELHPLTTPTIRLGILELRSKLNPSQEQALLAKAVADYKDGSDDSLATLCRWLMSHHGGADVVKLLPLDRVRKNRALLALREEALASIGEWSLVEKDLGDPTISGRLDDVSAAIYLAKAAARLGKPVAAEVNWDRAVVLAADDRRKLLMVGGAAEREHQSDRAEAAYRAAVALAPDDLTVQTTLLRFVSTHSGAKAAHRVLSAMTKQWPDDPAMRASEVYTGLLCSEVTPDRAREVMEPLARDFPANLSFRVSLAMALLRENQADAALRCLGDPFNPGTLPSSQSARVVHAVALGANGQRSLAWQEAMALRSARGLLPEERAMLQPLLTPGTGT